MLFVVWFSLEGRWEGVVRCVWSVPILRMKGVMFSLRQLKMVAVPGTWDPCLSAGIGVEPAASLRARCCFIYLKAQVTFLEECSREICLPGLSFYSPTPHFLSHTSLWRMKLRATSQVCHQNVTKKKKTPRWTFTICLTLRQSSFLRVEIRRECCPSRNALWLLGGRFTLWQEMQPVAACDILWCD